MNKKTVALSEEQYEKMDKMVQALIQSVSEPFLKKIGTARLFILVKDFWWMLSAIAIALIVFIVDIILKSIQGQIGTGWYFVWLVPVVVKIALEILKKVLSQKFVIKPIEDFCNKRARQLYEERIRTNIPNVAKQYEIDIVKYCFDNCSAFSDKK